MTLHAVISAASDRTNIMPELLDDLQWEQFQHDERYHREIVRLTMHERWKHMALHFAKYAGKLSSATLSDEGTMRIVVDTFIIALSTSNTVNVRASALLQAGAKRTATFDEFLGALVVGTGRMAAACEKLDHVEAFPFREEITQSIADILLATATFANAKGWMLDELVRSRLQGVREKWIHHGRR